MDLATTDKRIRRSHRLLREAFIEVVSELGYEATRVEDIIVRADIGRTTFYKHFNDKRALLEHVGDTFDSRYKRDLNLIISEPESFDIEAAVTEMFVQFAKHGTFFRLALEGRDVPLFYDSVRVAIKEMLTNLYQRQIVDKGFRPTIPFEVVVERALGTLLALAQWWLGEGQAQYTAAQMAEIFSGLEKHGWVSVMEVDEALA